MLTNGVFALPVAKRAHKVKCLIILEIVFLQDFYSPRSVQLATTPLHIFMLTKTAVAF